jgi:hypothetical protein
MDREDKDNKIFAILSRKITSLENDFHLEEK